MATVNVFILHKLKGIHVSLSMEYAVWRSMKLFQILTYTEKNRESELKHKQNQIKTSCILQNKKP